MPRKRKATRILMSNQAPTSAVNNLILRSLPAEEYNLILPHLELTTLTPGTVLHEVREPVRTGYFVNCGLISTLTVMSNGDSVEVGIVGSEGFSGLPALLNISSSSSRLIVQIAGEALKIKAGALHDVIAQAPTFERVLARFSYLQALHMAQIAACNRLHNLPERLARWLLMTQDRVGGDAFALTHEFLGYMLGTRRSSVTITAGLLQTAGVIEYKRGKIHILDRQKLEDSACECYEVVRSQLETYFENARALQRKI